MEIYQPATNYSTLTASTAPVIICIDRTSQDLRFFLLFNSLQSKVCRNLYFPELPYFFLSLSFSPLCFQFCLYTSYISSVGRAAGFGLQDSGIGVRNPAQ